MSSIDVVNGQRNDIFVSVENKSDRNVTLQNIAGSFHHADSGKLIKNVCCLPHSCKIIWLNGRADHSVDIQDSAAGGC